MGIAHPVGFDATGRPVVKDLALYPHILVTGTTGSGKSISHKILLTSLLSTYPPDKVNLLICDKAGDLLQFAGFPHLSHPIIQDFDSFLNSMLRLKEEMDRRIRFKGTKEFSKFPIIICSADEFTSFISGSDAKSKLVREVISEILRRGRHAKIHMILAAHNPTQQRLRLDISDIPTKMCFRVSRLSNSLTVLSEGGAEKLLGEGDMLFQSSQGDEIQRIKGAYITSNELKRVLSEIKSRLARQSFDDTNKFTIDEVDLQQEASDALTGFHAVKKRDFDGSLFADIIIWALERETISCNMICDTFSIGWRRANDFLDKLRKLGIVGDMYAKQPRAVLPVEIYDLPLEILDILISHGYKEEKNKEILSTKNNPSI